MASLVLLHTENIELDAELMVSAAAIVQLDDDRSISSTCDDGAGTLSLELTDADSDTTLSVGDSVRFEVDACDGITGSVTLEIDSLMQSGLTFDYLLGHVSQAISLDDSDLELRGEQDVEFTFNASGLTWRSTEAEFESESAGVVLAVRDTVVEKSLDFEADTYSFLLSGNADAAVGELDFSTPATFTGDRGNFPEAGRLRLTGDTSAAEISASDDPVTHPEIARYRVDEDGTGQYGLFSDVPWLDLVVGLFFDYDDGSDAGSSDFSSIRTRTKRLDGTIFDAVTDVARNRIYLSLTDLNQIAVVDMDSLLVTDHYYAGPGPAGLWLGADGDTLYIAQSQAGAIGALNLQTLALEYIDVTTAAGSAEVTEIIESSPDILFAAAQPPSMGSAYLARVDRSAGDAVTRVADGRIVSGSSGMAVSPDGQFLYVATGIYLFKLDLSDPAAPVVLETDFATGQPALSLDGTKVFTFPGEVLDAGTFESLGKTGIGSHYVANASEVYELAGRSDLDIFAVDDYELLDHLMTDCELSALKSLIPLSRPGQWLMYADSGFCALDLLDPLTPPGTDGEDAPPNAVPTVVLSSVRVSLNDTVGDMAYDATHDLLYVSQPYADRVVSFDATTLEEVESYAVAGYPLAIDLDASVSRLAIAMSDLLSAPAPLAVLNIASGTADYYDVSASLKVNYAHEVAWLSDDTVAVGASSGADSPIVRASLNGDPAVVLANGQSFDGNLRFVPDLAAARLYVADASLYTVYSIDLADASAPPLAELAIDNVPGGNSIALSPDRSTLAVYTGEVLRTSDLNQIGYLGEGPVAFSPDGTIAIVAERSGELHVYDARTFAKQYIAQIDCDEADQELRPLDAPGEWAVGGGFSICVVELPAEMPQAGKLTPSSSQSKLTTPSYFCGQDCLGRRYLLPRFDRLRGDIAKSPR